MEAYFQNGNCKTAIMSNGLRNGLAETVQAEPFEAQMQFLNYNNGNI